MKNQLKITGIALPEYSVKNNSPTETALAEAVREYPVISGDRLVFKKIGDGRFETSLYGTSNPAVVGQDGLIRQPLEDMTVGLFLRVSDTVSGDTAECDSSVKIKIKGAYDFAHYRRPKTVPSIREWCGSDGDFEFSGKIIYNMPSLRDAAEQICLFISDYTGVKAFAEPGDGGCSGDIVLSSAKSAGLGTEGYSAEISDICRVTAETEKGFLYAGATLAQCFSQSDNGRKMPRGIIRDYPEYPVRGIMIDTARYYMGIDYLNEVVKYAGFFKINRVHLHLNDGAGETKDSFRLQSEKYPELNRSIIETCVNGGSMIYTKNEFVQLQKNALEYGVEIVPEIDAPSHCRTLCMASESEQAKNFGFKSAALNSWQLNLRNNAFDNTVSFVQSVIDEYISGDEPIFCGKRLHIGTDEWIRDNELETYGITEAERNEMMRRYMDAMIRYVNSKGYIPVLWNGMNSGGKQYDGNTPVSCEAEFQTWSLGFSDVNVALEKKYHIINSNDSDLYIVPGVTYYKNDLDIKEMFDNWEANKFGDSFELDEGHPLLLGAESAIWLDASCGSSHIDLFKLLKNQVMLIAEKSWFGGKKSWQTSDEFMGRVKSLANYAAGANPGRYCKVTADGTVLCTDFGSICGNIAADRSGNGYDATVQGEPTENGGGLTLDGNKKIKLPIKTVANPFTLKMRINISSATENGAELFGGEDGSVYFEVEEQLKLCFSRKGYTYIFNQTVPTDEIITITVVCDEKAAYLSVNSSDFCKAELYKCDYEYKPEEVRALHTMQLPLERVFFGIKGNIYSIEIKKTAEEI